MCEGDNEMTQTCECNLCNPKQEESFLDIQIHAAKLELQRSDLILAAVATNHQWQNYDDHVNGLSGIYERLSSLGLLGWDVEQEKERRMFLRERVRTLEDG